MLINLKNNLHWLIYGAGLFGYFLILTQTTLTLSVIWLLFILYTWLVVSIATQQYCFECLLYIFCCSGLIVAISLFFVYGVEEVALPVGAILFKIEGILPALLLFFVFSIPLLIYNHDAVSKIIVAQTQPPYKEANKTTEVDKGAAAEEWEEATIQDLESGSYEPL